MCVLVKILILLANLGHFWGVRTFRVILLTSKDWLRVKSLRLRLELGVGIRIRVVVSCDWLGKESLHKIEVQGSVCLFYLL